jgi:iron(III) transport system ATP-binding protein
MTQLVVTGLHKAFGDHPVLTGLDLEVPAGSLTAILGPSGSGKTTLLRVLAGFERGDAGTVTIGGSVVDGPDAHLAPERRQIGYVPQEGSLFPHLTVAANVGFGLPPRQRKGPAIAELLDAVGLAGLGKRYPHQLSGGQQQRVALARALAIQPKIVLLDEPFASLDAHLRASVRADVQALLAETGVTGILVTHDQDEALSTADRVAVLRDGRIVQCDAPQDLYDRPADADIARFIGDANLIEGVLGTDTVDTILGRLRIEPACLDSLGPGNGAALGTVRSGPATVLVRPEQIELHADDAGARPPTPGWPGVDGDHELSGRVVSYGYHGHDAVIHVQPDHDSAAPTIIVRTLGGPQLPPGAPVTLHARGPVLAWPDAST